MPAIVGKNNSLSIRSSYFTFTQHFRQPHYIYNGYLFRFTTVRDLGLSGCSPALVRLRLFLGPGFQLHRRPSETRLLFARDGHDRHLLLFWSDCVAGHCISSRPGVLSCGALSHVSSFRALGDSRNARLLLSIVRPNLVCCKS